MKRLQRYYYLVGIPVLLLFLGTFLFFEPIAATVRGNPHPQINYVIFALFVIGSVLMLMHVHRINQEGLLVQDFMGQLKNGDEPAVVEAWLKHVNGKGRYDVADLLHEVLTLKGRVVGAVEHAAIQAEVERFQSQQQRRLLLAQYFAGLMVGMGLFGTFIGLLGALQEIGKLIGGFAIGPGMSDPVAAVSELVTRLTEPMKAMGVAFSASLFGVLGSMVMGMLMVFVKGGAAELVSLVHSRMSWLMDLSKATGAEGTMGMNVQPLQEALSELVQHSPLLTALTQALDQSERRVRQLVETNTVLAARLEQTVQMQEHLADQAHLQTKGQSHIADAVGKFTAIQQLSLTVLERSDLRQQNWTQMFQQQQQMLQHAITRDQPWGQAITQLTQSQTTQWQQLQSQWAQGVNALMAQIQQEREQSQQQLELKFAEQQRLTQALLSMIDRTELEQSKMSDLWQRHMQHQTDLQQRNDDAQQQWMALAQETQQQLQVDSRQRLTLAEHSRQVLNELQVRQEQLVHAVLSHKA